MTTDTEARFIDVAMPARNEAMQIADTLSSIHQQIPNDRYRFDIHIIANCCEDDTASVAQETIESFDPRPDIRYTIEESNTPGQANALNLVLGRSSTELFFGMDADVTVSSDCFMQVAEVLSSPGVNVSGPIPNTRISESLIGTELGDLYRAQQLFNEESRAVPIPWACMFGLRRESMGEIEFPQIADSFRYVSLRLVERYGWQTVQAATRAEVLFTPPGTMEDYEKQLTRWAASAAQLLHDYPEMGPVKDCAIRERQADVPSRSITDEKVRLRLQKEGIDPAAIDRYHTLRERARKIGEKSLHLVEGGLWEPVSP